MIFEYAMYFCAVLFVDINFPTSSSNTTTMLSKRGAYGTQSDEKREVILDRQQENCIKRGMR